MDYKYRKRQIFGKRLKVPKHILNKVYNCTLSFNEFIEYGLDDKIPTSCIIDSDRQIVEKFGIEKSKTLDWELLNKTNYYNGYYNNFKGLLMSIESSIEDVNHALYEQVKNQIKPSDYSSQMKKVYSDRLFELSENHNDEFRSEMERFNEGKISLQEIVRNWNLYKDKDLSYCLLNDKTNINGITDSDLKQFMVSYGTIVQLIFDNMNIYAFINELTTLTSDEEKKEYIKHFTDDILSNTRRESPIRLTNDQYKEIFKYSSMEDYLKGINTLFATDIIEQLKLLPKDYIFNMSIPFSELLDPQVLSFIYTYGLKNVVDFDNECENFFTKNNCKMLKQMRFMSLTFNGLEMQDVQKINNWSKFDENGNIIPKDEFYEVMKIKLIHSINTNDGSKIDLSQITGEFRARNPELFISEQAPEELQKLFYTKSITPQLLLEYPEYITYLKEKDISFFKQRDIIVKDLDDISYKNIYKFISSKTDFNGFINFITEYGDIFDIVFGEIPRNDCRYDVTFSIDDDITKISSRINESLRKIIIEKGLAYPNHIPKDLIEKYPTMFLNENAPQELQEAFYNRTITPTFILSNPAYKKFLDGVDLEFLFKYMPVGITPKNSYNDRINFVNALKQTFGDKEALDIMFEYGKYVEQVYDANNLKNFLYNPEFTQDGLFKELDSNILQTIIDGKMKYDESISSHFKNNYPTLFLNQNVSQDIRNKFYNREFTLNDFNSNPDLLEIFGDTNVVCGFPEEVSWMIPLFSDLDNLKIANYNRLKVVLGYYKIQDVALQNAFKEYVMELGNNIEIENIEYVSEVLNRVSLSNSSEMFNFRKELTKQILKSSNPLESLSKIEDVFIRNNVPTVGKIYSCFDILHPDFQGFDFRHDSKVSPILKKSSTMGKKIVVFSDLIKASFGSNNMSVNEYLKNIEIGSKLYESIKEGKLQYDLLNEVEQNELITFSKHLETLYNNTMIGKKESGTFISTGNVLTDILELSKKLSPDGTLDYNLADRVIRMFCGFAGIDTLEQAKEYIKQKVKTADLRNRYASNTDMVLEQGDFIKGIGDIKYLRDILQNGSVSKEYLGSSADSDLTPLDTDVSMIMSSDGKIKDKIEATEASGYGPIWFVLKNDDRFITTRTSGEELEAKRDMSKMEVFYTGVLGQGHYGIRTGFASSEINYIVMENYDPRVGLEIAMNGFYIPVANKDGKIVFTPNDYEKLRKKMNGLSYYGISDYKTDKSLHRESSEIYGILESMEVNKFETKKKSDLIKRELEMGMDKLNLKLKEQIDLVTDSVVLFNTGSTGRFTNLPGDGDFDYTMQVDRSIYSSEERMSTLRNTLIMALGRGKQVEPENVNGDIRELKTTVIDENGIEYPVEIDMTFVVKTDKTEYASDVCVSDRLNNIGLEQERNLVKANIILAKKFLKEIEAYKPARKFEDQGGMGGIGVENWILQNGGTLYNAAKSFMEIADKCSSFEEFKSLYSLPNFGYNHMAYKKGFYPHDDYIENMNDNGYQKMKKALSIYIKKYEKNVDSPVLETIIELKKYEENVDSPVLETNIGLKK